MCIEELARLEHSPSQTSAVFVVTMGGTATPTSDTDTIMPVVGGDTNDNADKTSHTSQNRSQLNDVREDREKLLKQLAELETRRRPV